MTLPYLSETEERRLVLRVLAYWQDLRGNRQFPAATDIAAEVVGVDWRNCALLDIHPSNISIRVACVGQNLGSLDLAAPQDVDVPAHDVASVLHRTVRQALQKRAPVCTGREFLVQNEKCLGRIITLPLSANDSVIDGFVVAMNWASRVCVEYDAEDAGPEHVGSGR